MRLVSGFCIRDILGEKIAIPSQEAARHLSGLASLNETGEFLFRLLENEQTEETLVKELLDNYEIDSLTATTDVQNFIQKLRENKLLVE